MPTDLDMACCACLIVRFDPIDNGDGSKSERWTCSAGCGSRFVRATLAEAERDRLRAQAEYWERRWRDETGSDER